MTGGPLEGRRPTSHERMAGQSWDESYRGGPAPWDIGTAQPAVVRLASAGAFVGTVLDVGCGTGDNAIHIASQGDIAVLGVDVAETGLAMARQRAAGRNVAVEFEAADALRLDRLNRTFDTVLDCGLFHALDTGEQKAYARSLASVTKRDGTLYLLCFSDEGPSAGPHPVSRADLSAAFDGESGWQIVTIEPERLQTRYHDDAGAPAWCATIRRR